MESSTCVYVFFSAYLLLARHETVSESVGGWVGRLLLLSLLEFASFMQLRMYISVVRYCFSS